MYYLNINYINFQFINPLIISLNANDSYIGERAHRIRLIVVEMTLNIYPNKVYDYTGLIEKVVSSAINSLSFQHCCQ